MCVRVWVSLSHLSEIWTHQRMSYCYALLFDQFFYTTGANTDLGLVTIDANVGAWYYDWHVSESLRGFKEERAVDGYKMWCPGYWPNREDIALDRKWWFLFLSRIAYQENPYFSSFLKGKNFYTRLSFIEFWDLSFLFRLGMLWSRRKSSKPFSLSSRPAKPVAIKQYWVESFSSLMASKCE